MHIAKILLGLFLMAAVMLSGGECFCEDIEDRDIRTMSGTIDAINTFDSMITVKWQDYDLIHFNKTTFKIPEGMKFYKETDIIDIFDLNINDPVNIEYYIDNTGRPIMVRMDVSQ
ncbi:MAG: hypothetical protein JXB40_05875 [Candidatus Omnitrophica bacterium]|nr:hypothetical protein [Candidatus Omnitrophota bacterium]